MNKNTRYLIIVFIFLALFMGILVLLQNKRVFSLPCILNRCPLGGTCSRFEAKTVCLMGYQEGTICEHCQSRQCQIGESYPLSVFCTSSLSNNLPNNKESCIDRGGEWRVRELPLSGLCFLKMTDANKDCESQSDCQGLCLAPENAKTGEQAIGKCSEYNLNLGCHSSVESGKVMPVLCVE